MSDEISDKLTGKSVLGIYISDEMKSEIEKEAEAEKRRISHMASILILEALSARRGRDMSHLFSLI